MTKKEIIVCRECQLPLIWTFMWAYYEYYCINCGGHEGALGAGDRVPYTKELRLKYKQIQGIWRAIKHYLVPFSQYTKHKCKKCKTEQNHRLHLSIKEKNDHRVANKVLEAAKGAFSWK